jgi:Tol biopolymer transport system component
VTARRLSSFFLVLAAWLALPAFAGAATNGRIVFSSARDGSFGTSELYSVAPDGSGATRLTRNSTMDQYPAWSPDGSQIAFQSFAQGQATSIHVMSAHGAGERRVTPETDGSDEMQPSWSPDGSQIAFASTRGFNGSWHIWMVNADGSGLRQVTSEFSTGPAWSPDGSRIAYVGAGEGLAVVNADGTGARRLTLPPTGYLDEAPSWSPDGSGLVFARRETFGNAPQLYLIDADGSDERQLTSGPGANRFPSWSPDGTQIVFTHDRQLYVVKLDGTGMRPLTTEFGDALSPNWGTSTVVPAPEVPGAPRITIFSPEARFYVPGEQVMAFYFCESDTSFVVSCEGDLPLGSPIDMETTGTRTFTVRAMDAEGRVATKSVTFEVLDFRRPTVHVRAPADGAEYELGESVLVDYECDDGPGGSGIEVCAGDLQPGQPLDTSRARSFTVTFFAVDRAHNVGVTTVTYRVVERDRTAPTITVGTPGDASVYVLGATVTARYSCRDEPEGSGLEACQGDTPSGSALDTSSVGPHSLTVTARDRAGNTSTLTRRYRVVYAFSGFFAPLRPFPELASLEAGETVPVKFSLAGDQGLGILASGSPTWRPVDCASGTPLGDASGAGHTLAYLTGSDRYHLHVESDAGWRGTCRRLAVRLADGTTHFADVRFG